MLTDLSAGQYEGWVAWMRKYQPYPNREDVHWAKLIALTHNQWAEHPMQAWDASPYIDQFDEDITVEELVRRVGI